MADKYYWIKLRNTFLTSRAVDFLMSQPNGANYVVLYQCLCLNTINTDGELASMIGEMIVPYDIPKIQRDCKWFSEDTVRVALALYQKLGLVYVQENGILKINEFDKMVGNETKWAGIKRLQREKKKEQLLIGQCPTDVQQDIRDKSIRYLDNKKEEKKEENENERIVPRIVEPRSHKFIKPTIEEIEAYANEKGYELDAEHFIAFYESNGWKVGKNPMKSWQGAVANWVKRQNEYSPRVTTPKVQPISNVSRQDAIDALEEIRNLRKRKG